MKGHYVVTGCAGFIGSHLTDRLLADGHQSHYPRAVEVAREFASLDVSLTRRGEAF